MKLYTKPSFRKELPSNSEMICCPSVLLRNSSLSVLWSALSPYLEIVKCLLPRGGGGGQFILASTRFWSGWRKWTVESGILTEVVIRVPSFQVQVSTSYLHLRSKSCLTRCSSDQRAFTTKRTCHMLLRNPRYQMAWIHESLGYELELHCSSCLFVFRSRGCQGH